MIATLCGARLGYGLWLILTPGRALRICAERPTRSLVTVVRVLGLRHVVQAGLLITRRDALTVRAGLLTDTLHCLSMVAAASAGLRRRAAAADSVIAGLWASTGIVMRRYVAAPGEPAVPDLGPRR